MVNKRLFGKICYVQRQMSRENAQLFAEYGISPVQMHALVFIIKNADKGLAVCQKDVERELNLRPSSVSSLLSNLERQGFLTRTLADGDARTKRLELTDKGRDICFKDKLLMEKCDGAIASALTGQEQEQLDELLKKIIDAISN
ncbi:MAG: winged helix-turn-helix transcriptional regulator [Clostridia bacterium]|nr:winged helix-turn-helix transcriptional regulator [Clostridia bacterium]